LLHSNILNEDRQLLVNLPNDYVESLASYPVLFVLYGGQVRGYFAEAVHVVDRLSEEGSIPRMIVIGVANTDRYRDLSPVGRRGRASGIEPFSRFVIDELIPYVESEYRTKDYRLLVGPQAGAEFALYTLVERPELFDAFIIENPFRSQPVHSVLKPLFQKILEKGPPSPVFLQVTGADRVGSATKGQELGYMREFEKTLTNNRPENLTLVTYYIEGGEDFLPPLQLKEGLRELFSGYRFPEDVVVDGLGDITGHYRALSGRFGFTVDIPEMTLAFKADELRQKGEVDSARVILEYLITVQPASVNGYWGLANLHREKGDRGIAIEYYRKCLEIMPNMPPARHWLEKLEGDQ
jgi:hypothetical protein